MIDGKIVAADPQSVFLSGAGARVPIIVGANSMDLGFGFAATKEELFSPFGVDRDKAVKAYDPQGTLQLEPLQMNVMADRMMLEPSRFVATISSSRNIPSFEYRFSYVAESMRSQWPGAPHATEIPYVFDTVGVKYGEKLAPMEERIAQSMLAYWVAFAKTGDPSNGTSAAWPRYSPETDEIMNFTSDGPVAEADPWKARLNVTAAYVSGAAPTPPQSVRP